MAMVDLPPHRIAYVSISSAALKFVSLIALFAPSCFSRDLVH
jgi:hypothetical protein